MNDDESRLDDFRALTDSRLNALDVEDLLDELLARVRDILDADTAAVLLLDRDGDELVARAARGIEDEVRQGVRVPVGHGFAGRIAATKAPVRLERVDAATVANPILWEHGIRVMAGVPLLSGEQVLGVLHVGRLSNRPFTDSDVELLQIVAERVASATLARQLAVEQAAASLLERSLLPGSLPRCPGLSFAARYVPSEGRTVGGDWYDVFRLPSGDVWLVVGDVAGHGLRAAVVMGRIRSALRAYALLGIGPERVLELVDRKVQHFEIETIATVAVAVTSPPHETVQLALAGHPPPVLASGTGPAELVTPPVGPPLGTLPGVRRSSVTLRLEPGDVLAFYTDGLVERRKEPVDVGFRRLRELVTTQEPDRVAHALMRELVGSRSPYDDIALVVVRRTPETSPSPEPRSPQGEDTMTGVEDRTASVEQRFPSARSTPAAVRTLVRDTLAGWQLDGFVEVGELLADELAGNAVRHVGGPLTLRVTRTARSVRIAVEDPSRNPPRLVVADPDALDGRGIMLVDALASRWGFEVGNQGKTVWFELELET